MQRRWPLHGLGNCLSIAIIVLVALEEWLHVLSRDEANIMLECPDLSRDVMRASAGFQADEATGHVGETPRELAACYLAARHDRAPLVETDKTKRVLTDVDDDGGDRIQRILMGAHRRLQEL